jgi:hypothetical protein
MEEQDMDIDIELLDRQRLRAMQWFCIGFIVFMPLTMVRFFLRLSGLNTQPIGYIILAFMIAALIVVGSCTLVLALLGRRIATDPRLQAALHNEFVQSLRIRSWKAAYLGAVGSVVFFALAELFYPICDPMMIALTTILSGAGAYHLTFYFRYRAS